MLYYQVNQTGAQKKVRAPHKDFLVRNELLTERDLKNMIPEPPIHWFIPVSISKKSVYWFFGARFAPESILVRC